MRKSVFFTITTIFALALISVSITFLWLMRYDKQNYTRELNTKYSIVAKSYIYSLNRLISDDEFHRQIENFDFSEINNMQKEQITQNGQILGEILTDIGSASIIFYKNHNYLQILHKDTILLLKDKDYEPYRYLIFKLIYGLIVAIFLITYIVTIRKIKPLRKLKREIDKFANGSLEIRNVSKGKDEISEVATAFYEAVSQLKKMGEARQLFLRNIMHELKTPITKGRISAEMIENSKNRDRLISVFEKLESLINEFAAVERANSGMILHNFINCSIDDIINEAIDKAMIEHDKIKILEHENFSVNVDFDLFSIAVKNMIDNGLKYANDEIVRVEISPKRIKFITKGEKLEKDLEFYTEPFSKGKNAKQSFGLGLYIVANILKSHNLKLTYNYENSDNIFSFENLEIITQK